MLTNWKTVVLAAGICLGIATSSVAHAQVAHVAVAQDEAGRIVESGAAANEYVTLRLNLMPGSEYKLASVSRTKMTIVEAARNGRPSSKTEFFDDTINEMNYAVLWNNPDGTTQIRLTYGAIKIVNNSLKVDGKTIKTPSTRSPLNALVGQQISLRISPRGAVSDVRGMDKIWERAFGGKIAGMTPQMQAQMRSSMKKMLGDNFVKEIMRQASGQFSENPVRIGGSWMDRVQTSGAMPFDVSLKRTLQGRANGLLSIGESGTMKIGDATDIAMTGGNLQMQISGTYSGTTLLDETTCFVHSSDTSQRFGGSTSANVRGHQMKAQLYSLSIIKVTVEKVK